MERLCLKVATTVSYNSGCSDREGSKSTLYRVSEGCEHCVKDGYENAAIADSKCE